MKVTVLGGAAAGGNTGQGCSGYLVGTTTTRLVLDLGPGTLLELRRHTDFRTLTGIVISHLHLDHVLDLLALRFALAYNPVKAPARLPLWLPPGGLAFLARAAAAFEPDAPADFFASAFDAAEYEPATTLAIGDTRVTFAPTVHYVPCWAIRVQGANGEGDLGYTADTGPASDLDGFLGGVRVLIAEGTWLRPRAAAEPFAERGHLTATEAADLATRVGAETLILTHWWEENGVATYREQAAAGFAGRLEVASPGCAVEWS